MIAMFVVKERPGTVRMTPGRGDSGIDLLWRDPDNPSAVEIYQVKRYAQRLISSQKSKVKKSLQRAVEKCSEQGWTLTKWHLVLPRDHTETEEQWFRDICKNAGVIGVWKGLTQVDLWCASYPYVVDYYLRDGSEAVGANVASLTKIIDGLGPVAEMRARPGGEDFTVDTAANVARVAASALNTRDPHYRFEVLVTGESVPPPRGDGFVLQRETRDADDQIVTVRIFERFEGALSFRPIPLSIQFDVVPGTDEHRQLREFYEHGRPFDGPIPASMTIDLPGGIGLESSTGRVLIGEPGQDGVTEPERVLDAVDHEGNVTASIRVEISGFHVSPDSQGATTKLTDSSGILAGELLWRLGEDGLAGGKIRLHIDRIAGRFPDEVLDIVEFIAALSSGAQLRMRMPRGSTDNALVLGVPGLDQENESRGVARFVRDLAAVQESVEGGIRIPDVIEPEEADSVLLAAALIAGRELGYTWTEVEVILREGVDLDSILDTLCSENGTTMVHDSPLTVTVDGRDYLVGTQRWHYRRAVSDQQSLTTSEDGTRRITIRPHESDRSMVKVGSRERKRWLHADDRPVAET
ncbi:hypothetical protein [Tsukamurella tyrosinosolvens]|uniref:hypothetical protein n=1 Tax=Tsukamurella tyrosinosolvens TaxID=57704 RepID=UPI002DD424BD|nr:hypothetical protein [Tsukamurella tyrosinosolvens]MEC4614025.1 hypothetical protein [Tsukamurella tyrosinosolvens]